MCDICVSVFLMSHRELKWHCFSFCTLQQLTLQRLSNLFYCLLEFKLSVGSQDIFLPSAILRSLHFIGLWHMLSFWSIVRHWISNRVKIQCWSQRWEDLAGQTVDSSPYFPLKISMSKCIKKWIQQGVNIQTSHRKPLTYGNFENGAFERVTIKFKRIAL